MNYSRDYLRQLDAEDMANIALRQSAPTELEQALAEELLVYWDADKQHDEDMRNVSEEHEREARDFEDRIEGLEREIEQLKEENANLRDDMNAEALAA